MISSVQTNVHNIYACVSRDFDLRCFLGKPGILDRRPASISVGIPACHTPVTANISNVTAKRVDAGITGTVKSSSSAPRATARRTGNSAPEVKGNGPGGTWPKTQRIGYDQRRALIWRKKAAARLCYPPRSAANRLRKQRQAS
jgi:hypothetical protein